MGPQPFQMNIESCLACALHNRQCHRLSFCTCQEIPYKCVEATNPPTHLTSQSYQSPITNLIKRQAGLHSAFFDIRYPLAVKDLWSGIQNPNTFFPVYRHFLCQKREWNVCQKQNLAEQHATARVCCKSVREFSKSDNSLTEFRSLSQQWLMRNSPSCLPTSANECPVNSKIA